MSTTHEIRGHGAAPSTAAIALSAVALTLMGAIAGFFYAYSSSVMRGLDAADPASAIVAMQGINATVRNAFFAPAFFGAPLVGLIAAGAMWLSKRRAAATAMAAASVVYLLGALMPTFMINIPMNEALAIQSVPTDPQAAAAMWREYSAPWTFWNHMRMGASFVALLLVGASIYLAGRTRQA